MSSVTHHHTHTSVSLHPEEEGGREGRGRGGRGEGGRGREREGGRGEGGRGEGGREGRGREREGGGRERREVMVRREGGKSNPPPNMTKDKSGKEEVSTLVSIHLSVLDEVDHESQSFH